MGGKKSKAPPAPDYAAQARAQGQADLQTAQYLTEANRVNQYAPTGSSTWTATNSDAYNQAKSNLDKWTEFVSGATGAGADDIAWARTHQLADAQNAFNQANTANNRTWEQRINLTPEEQRIFDAEQANRLSMEGLAGTAIGNARNTLSQQFNPVLRDFYNAQGLEADRVGLTDNTLSGMGDLAESSDAFSAENRRVQDALYQQLTRFSGERFQREEDAERSRLAQMGLQEGTRAYQNALQEFRRSKDESYAGAQLQSVLAGGQEQSRLFGDQLAARQSNIGLRQGQFQQGMSRDQMDLYERQARATSEMNMANLAGSQRQQQFGEQSYLRSLPINEISALLSGGGVNMPQFGGYSQATPFNAPDLLGASQAQYNAQMGAYNNQQQQAGQKAGLLGGVGQAAGTYFGGPLGGALGGAVGGLLGGK